MPGMKKRPGTLTISEEQALFFRCRRQHLAGPGASDPVAAARAVVGVQSQQLNPSLWGLSLRCAGLPSASELVAAIHGEPRTMVRTWGQRDTIHIYDPQRHWAPIVAARPLLSPAGRRGGMPPSALVARAAGMLARADGPLTRSDLMDVVPRSYLDAIDPKVGDEKARLRFAAGRLLWRLNQDGLACLAHKVGAEQAYAPRRLWFPDLDWPEELPEPHDAATALVRAYLGSYGPASPRDVAHFFGVQVGKARFWIESLADGGEIAAVECGDRKELVALAGDAVELLQPVPRGIAAWPLRLLPRWDGWLMGHADKGWTVPREPERPLVWGKAALVAPVVLDRGRVAATWSHRQTGKRLTVEIRPLSGWRAKKHLPGVRREAASFARHLGMADVELEIAGEPG